MAKQTLELQHIDFLYEQGAILFHDLLPSGKIKGYREALASLKCASKRNVWQCAPLLQTLCFSHQLAHIAGQLSRLKALRFGCDHYFASFKDLTSFFSEGKPLNEMISIDGLEIALLLNLSNSMEMEHNDTSPLPLLSGSGTFFNTAEPLKLAIELPEGIFLEGPFLLITYCKANARYLHKPLDPFTHDVKKEKCGFGDLLANTHHPLLHHS